MPTELLFVLSGVLAGTVAGLIPGVGVLVSLILLFPFLHGSGIIELLLFYMALAATVQFTGTIPAVFAGLPGENNSIPAVHEGAKFARRRRSDIAVGICTLGSTLGAVVAVLLFFIFSKYALASFATIVSTRFQSILFLGVMLAFIIFYNNHKIHVNILLIAAGMFFGMIGESPVSPEYRFTFGIKDLQWGIEKLPLVSGLLVAPILFNKYATHSVIKHKIKTSFAMPMVAFLRNFTSAIRGSLIGFIGGLVPGLSTMLSTTMSHAVESKLHPNRPMKKIIACETGNNSGQFASLLPLLLFGIPITGSEIFLYSMLVEAGWDPNQLGNIGNNISFMFATILPYFVLVNILGVIISWPLAKHAMVLFRIPYQYIAIFVITVVGIVNFYIGYINYREVSMMLQLIFFSAIGIALRNYNMLPAVAAFLLSNDIESVVVREYLFFIH